MPFPKFVIIEGESGKEYEFNLYPKNYDFNKIGEIGAVYLFLGYIVSEDDFDILYIGQTSRLSERIDGHEKWKCVNKYGCTHIAFKPVSRESRRLEIETDLRHAHPTKCNEQ